MLNSQLHISAWVGSTAMCCLLLCDYGILEQNTECCCVILSYSPGWKKFLQVWWSHQNGSSHFSKTHITEKCQQAVYYCTKHQCNVIGCCVIVLSKYNQSLGDHGHRLTDSQHAAMPRGHTKFLNMINTIHMIKEY